MNIKCINYYIILNSIGCDSVIAYDLTNFNSTSSSENVIVCEEYNTLSGKVLNATGVYTDIIPNAAGCDSVITIDLEIFPVDVSVTVNGDEIWANQLNASY